MKKNTRFVGLDVHKKTVAVAVAEPGGEVVSLGTIANTPEAFRRLVRRLRGTEGVKFCYEAGPCGFAIYWHLAMLGMECEVIAPSLIRGSPVIESRRTAVTH